MSDARRLVRTRPTGVGRARGIVSDRASGARVDARSFTPHPDLAGVVEVLWAGDWDLVGQPSHVTELLADPCVHVVFEDGGTHAGSRVVGVWTRLWIRRLEGRGRVRGIKLKPGAVRAFFDAPAHQLTDRITPLSAFTDADLAPLEAAVLAGESDAGDFAPLEGWLLDRRRPADRATVDLAIAVMDRIARDRSITTVESLCAIAGLSKRPLQRLFRDYVGAPPKWAIRRYRLQEAAVRLEAGTLESLAALADALGYTDQAHLTRDFKAATGRSPGRFQAAMQDAISASSSSGSRGAPAPSTPPRSGRPS